MKVIHIGARDVNVQKVMLLEDQLFALDMKGWLENEFLTWEWWLLLCFFVVPWILWSIMKKREWLIESVLFGVIVMVITILLDTVGLQFTFWEYPIEFLPVIPRAFPFDISMIPVAFMLLFQYARTWKSFVIAQLIMALPMLLSENHFANGLTSFTTFTGITFTPSSITFFLVWE